LAVESLALVAADKLLQLALGEREERRAVLSVEHLQRAANDVHQVV